MAGQIPPVAQFLPRAFETGVEGVRAGMARLDRGAAEVVKAGASFSSTDSVTISAAARSRAEAPRVEEPDLAEGILDLRLAKHEVAANVKTLRTADETIRELVDVPGRKPR